MTGYPELQNTVLDTTDVRGLAEFYRQLLGLRYLPGDEPPAEGGPEHARALGLGAELLLDRTEDPDEPLYVYADPAGHPFCIFVG